MEAQKKIRRGATKRCTQAICNSGNPKKKDLIVAETFNGTICKHCFCVHEWEYTPPVQEIEPIETEKEHDKRMTGEIEKAKEKAKTRKKKTVKQTGINLDEMQD